MHRRFLSDEPISYVSYKLQIPDISRPVPNEQKSEFGSGFERQPLPHINLTAEDLVGRTVTAVSTLLGTNGAGAHGFFGLQFETQWFVIPIYGAGSWITVQNRLISDKFSEDYGRERPWVRDERDDLSPILFGSEISNYNIGKHTLSITFAQGHILKIDEDPAARPIFQRSRELRSFLAEDDLRKAVCLSPTNEIWT
jgi:hypothetical protein